jgi:hypothetical protein
MPNRRVVRSGDGGIRPPALPDVQGHPRRGVIDHAGSRPTYRVVPGEALRRLGSRRRCRTRPAPGRTHPHNVSRSHRPSTSSRHRLLHAPNIIAPRHILLTETPVRPRRRWCMTELPLAGLDRAHSAQPGSSYTAVCQIRRSSNGSPGARTRMRSGFSTRPGNDFGSALNGGKSGASTLPQWYSSNGVCG